MHKHAVPAPSNIRVLVVDDDEDLRLTLVEYLKAWDFSVQTARNGAEAMDLLCRHDFEIVLTDLVMPDTSGLDIVKAARTMRPDARVVVMTGFSSMESAIESIRAGAFDYITKPFQLAQIEILITRILEHLHLVSDNQRLSRQVAALANQSRSVDTRLDQIEALLSRILAIVDTPSKTLTPHGM